MDPTLGVMLAVAAAGGGIDPNVILAGVLSAAAAVGASLITSRVARRASKDSSMLEWAKQLQASEQEARREARESRERADRIREEADTDVEAIRSQLDGLKAELRSAQALAARLTDTLTMVASEVWRPEPDIPAVRRLVGRPSPPAVNGRQV